MLEAYGLSDPGIVRQNNEDYFLVEPSLGLYVVADGMGGAQAGEHASRLAAETVLEYIQGHQPPDAEALLHALADANRKVLHASEQEPLYQGMGTTLTAALHVRSELLLANVGDSRAYLYQFGQLHAITEDQTWVNEVGRKLGMQEEQLRVHPMRHVLTMAIGVSDALRIHSYVVPLVPESLFLLCSDGLHGVVDNGTIAEILGGRGALESKCHSLIEAARRAGGPDNITAVILAVAPDA